MPFETLKYTIVMLFIPNTLILIPVLISLSISKKRFINYEEQIVIEGKITKRPHLLKLMFDPFLAFYIFSEIPTEMMKPTVYKFDEMKELRNRIQMFTKIAKSLSIFLGVLSLAALLLFGILTGK